MRDARGKDHLRRVEGARQPNDSRAVVNEKSLRPGRAAIGGAEHAAVVAFLVDVALCRDYYDVRIAWIDLHRGNLLRRFEPDVSPGASGIRGFVNAVPFVDAPAGNDVTGARVYDISIRRRDFDRAYGRHLAKPIQGNQVAPALVVFHTPAAGRPI